MKTLAMLACMFPTELPPDCVPHSIVDSPAPPAAVVVLAEEDPPRHSEPIPPLLTPPED